MTATNAGRVWFYDSDLSRELFAPMYVPLPADAADAQRVRLEPETWKRIDGCE
jgi:hypothetical protein